MLGRTRDDPSGERGLADLGSRNAAGFAESSGGCSGGIVRAWRQEYPATGACITSSTISSKSDLFRKSSPPPAWRTVDTPQPAILLLLLLLSASSAAISACFFPSNCCINSPPHCSLLLHL